ncbi:hypothetical protein CMI37_25560 [Candidatus Pacearchaeota archaeon]|nr:hypothetical protein [Candidatus Pacearchaeota archaeon]
MTVYCNITDCKNWLPLQDIKHMDHKPGFTPFGKTDEYHGRCAFKAIKIESTTARSQHTKQVLAVCGSYNSDEPTEFQCLEERCQAFVDPTTCSKIKYDENLYVGWTVVFDDLEKKEVPRCKSFAHRKRENAFNWGNAAQGIF